MPLRTILPSLVRIALVAVCTVLLGDVAYAAGPAGDAPLIQNDAITFGILMLLLAFVFYTSNLDSPGWKRFYGIVPSLLLCYFLPSILGTTGIISTKSPHSEIYFVSSRYLLPASLVLLTLSIDLREVVKLGPKALIMFFTGTAGIVIGGPLAILIVGSVSPETVGAQAGQEVWRGMATVAGTWIGGGANQAAMKETFDVNDELYSAFLAVDVLVANLWMAGLLIIAARAKGIDRKFKADDSAVEELKEKMSHFQKQVARIPSTSDLMVVCAVAFAVVAIGHVVADALAPWIKAEYPDLHRNYSLGSPFFWLVVTATTLAIVLSFTKARQLEGAGASKVGSVFLYVLVAAIGTNMDLSAVVRHPGFFAIGLVWMAFHVILLFIMARIIRAPMFFLAVGSKANVGGAASAPIIASAFHPSLAPVGVLLAVVGYALGTYAAYLCGIIMRAASG